VSLKVELHDLPDAVGQVGATVFLLSTNADASPHPAHVRVSFADGVFTLSAGRRSCANSTDRPAVTLLWPAGDPDSMNLIVDGVAESVSVDAGVVTVVPTSAMWHRQPDQPPH
jgi:hypothetical protein